MLSHNGNTALRYCRIRKNFLQKICNVEKNGLYLQPLSEGAIAQLVEQRTENPCVPRSIRGGTTKKHFKQKRFEVLFLCNRINEHVSYLQTVVFFIPFNKFSQSIG